MTIRSMLVGCEQAKTTSGLHIHPPLHRTMSTRGRFIGAGNVRHTGRDGPKILAHQKIEARTGPARASRKAAAGSGRLPREVPPVEQRISLVTLGVAELARARAFYEALGWRGAKQPDEEVCFFQAGGMVFGLWTALGGHGAPGIELAHNVRTPEDVGALLGGRRACRRHHHPPSSTGRVGRNNRSVRRPRRLRVGGGPQPRLDHQPRRHSTHLTCAKPEPRQRSTERDDLPPGRPKTHATDAAK